MTRIDRRGFAGGILAGLGCALGSIAARAGAKPAGEVILSINSSDFDLAMIEALPKQTIKTSTPWTEGVTEFEGVLLGDLLNAAGATGSTVKAAALNDYAVEMPLADTVSKGALVAYRMNGEAMSVRDKGPLWIIFPFDDRPELKNEETFARAVWQLRRITVSG